MKQINRPPSVFLNNSNDIFFLNCENPITAIASDVECRFLVVGGRDLFKLLEVNPEKDQKITIRKNLRKLGQAPKQPGISYLEWNPINNYKVIAASVMGTFSIWDFKDGDVRFDKTYKGNNHSINSLNWNPQNEKMFASASNDGALKIWDTDKDTEKPIFLIQKNNENMRGVRFHQTQSLIVAGYDSGGMDLFDLRKIGETQTTPLYSKRVAHNSPILALDWNKQSPTYLASGSQKKEIKVWKFSENYDESAEKVNIQNLAGVNNVKWRSKREDEIFVSSISFDFTVSVWSMNYEYHPKAVFKGHKDVVNGFVLSPKEDFIITASRDNYLIYQSFSNAYCPFDACNKAALGFNVDDVLIFRTEHPNVIDKEELGLMKEVSWDALNPQKKLGDNFTPSIMKRKERELMLFDVNGLEEEAGRFTSIHEEIEYFANNYKISGNTFHIYESNAKVAEEKLEFNVANIWRNTHFILEDSKKKTRENKIKNVKTKPLTTSKKMFVETLNDSFKTPLPLPLPLQHNNSSPLGIDPPLNLSNFHEEHLKSKSHLNLEDLYEYFNKNVENLKLNLELKTFGFKNDILYFKKSLIREFQKNVNNSIEKEADTQNSECNLEEITNKTIIDTLQDLIDQGKIQHAFIIYSAFQNKIKIDDKTLKRWTHGYLELLRTHKLYKLANRCLKDSKINEYKENSKKETIIHTRCGKCKKSIEYCSGYLCSNCKSSVKCGICQKPIKGLIMWCQICSHSGHMKEIAEWFKTNKECPVGCGHRCFDYYKQKI